MFKSHQNSDLLRTWILTGIFLLSLGMSNLLLWDYYTRLNKSINSFAEANQTLAWQAEVAIRQSERFYEICQKSEACVQENIPSLNFTTNDLPTVKGVPRARLIVWLICQVVFIPLWFVIVFSYRKLNQRYESLKFDYQNLLEAQRRDHR